MSDANDLARFDLTPQEAVARQRALRDRVVLRAPAGFEPRLVAGLDLSMDRGSPIGFAGMIVIDQPTMRTVDEVGLAAPLTFPYVSGLLSFRELPLLAEVWARRRVTPDVLIFDGQGIAHPRRFGIASHVGLLLDTPTIGVAKTRLVGEHRALPARKGAWVPLVDRGETIGAVLRTRAGVAPLFVSIGHRVSLEAAVRWVMACTTRYRLPETTRWAHHLASVDETGTKLGARRR